MMGKARNTRLWNVSTNRPWNAAKSYAIVDYDVEFLSVRYVKRYAFYRSVGIPEVTSAP